MKDVINAVRVFALAGFVCILAVIIRFWGLAAWAQMTDFLRIVIAATFIAAIIGNWRSA